MAAAFKTLDDLDLDRQARAAARRSQRAGRRRQGHRCDPHRAHRPHHPRDHQGRRQGDPAQPFRPAQGQGRPEFSLEQVVPAVADATGHPVGFIDTDWTDVQAGQGGDRRRAATARSSCSRTPASIRARRRTTRRSPSAWPRLGDIYVNDAFSAAHRAHASTEGLAHLLPSAAGRAMQAELEALEAGLGNPKQPGDRARRRRQGLDQDRPAREPRHQGRGAGDRRRHGQHLPPCARASQVGKSLCREGPRRDRQPHPGQGRGRPLRHHPAGRRRSSPGSSRPTRRTASTGSTRWTPRA